jgi:hypothetical protein
MLPYFVFFLFALKASLTILLESTNQNNQKFFSNDESHTNQALKKRFKNVKNGGGGS